MDDQTLSRDASGALVARIRRGYGSLSRLERQLADIILDRPAEIAGYTATELAGLAGVSKMTVSRLVRRLGYTSFEEARLASRNEADRGSPLYLLPKDDGHATAPSLEAHFRRSIDAIQATARLIDAELITGVAAALHQARNVWVCGLRNSVFLAGYARWQFIQFRSGVYNMTGSGETFAETLADIGPDDLLFLVAIRRRPPVIRRLLQTAMARRLPLVLLTDSHTPTSIDEPRMTLRCETRSLTALDNHVAAMAVIHAVAAELIHLSGGVGRERIGRIEDLHDDIGEM